jgi:hypothetical protein
MKDIDPLRENLDQANLECELYRARIEALETDLAHAKGGPSDLIAEICRSSSMLS